MIRLDELEDFLYKNGLRVQYSWWSGEKAWPEAEWCVTNSVTENDLAQLHRYNQALDNRVRQAIVFGQDRPLDRRRAMSNALEAHVRDRLAERGYGVSRTRHQEHYDLVCQGVRIEVKASRWDGTRWQWNLHNNAADVAVLACLRQFEALMVPVFFVLPFEVLEGRTVVKLYNPTGDPSSHVGRFTRFYEAWEWIDELVAAGRNAWQLPLLGV